MKLAALAFTACLLTPADARGDDPPTLEPWPGGHVVLKSSPGILHILFSGKNFDLPEGTHLVDAPAWSVLDMEMRRLQEVSVRLAAENDSMRRTAKFWQPGWKTLAVTLVTGIALGAYVGLKL